MAEVSRDSNVLTGKVHDSLLIFGGMCKEATLQIKSQRQISLLMLKFLCLYSTLKKTVVLWRSHDCPSSHNVARPVMCWAYERKDLPQRPWSPSRACWCPGKSWESTCRNGPGGCRIKSAMFIWPGRIYQYEWITVLQFKSVYPGHDSEDSHIRNMLLGWLSEAWRK